MSENKQEILGEAVIPLDDPRKTIYANISGGISDVIKGYLTEPQTPTKLADISLKGLKTAIRGVKLATDDVTRIKQALIAHADKVERFIANHGYYYLNHTKTYQKPITEPIKGKGLVWINENDYKPILNYFTPAERTITYTPEDIKRQQERYNRIKAEHGDDPNYLNPEPDKVGDSWTFTGYSVTDYKGLVQAIKETPSITPLNTYNITDPNESEQDGYHLDPVLVEISKLAKEIGLEPSGDIWARREFNPKNGNKRVTLGMEYKEPTKGIVTEDIRYSDRLTYSVLLWAIVRLKEKADKDRRTSTPVNLRKDYHGDYAPKPPIDSTIKDIENPNPEKYKTLQRVYRTNEAIKEDNGLFATVTDPTLFDMLPIEYQDPIKLLSLYNRSNRRGLITCFRYAEANPNPPTEIKIEDLAKYNGAYAKQIQDRGYLDTYYREQLFNELIIVKGTNTFYTYFDKKTNKEMIGSIRFFDFDLSTDGKIIKNFRYTDEYLRALNDKRQAMLHLAIPKEVDLLDQTAQDIAYKIIQKQVDKRQMAKTIRGEPIKILLSDIYKGILATPTTKQQRAKRKVRTLDALSKIKQTGTIISGFEVERHSKKDYVMLYPAEYMQKAYKDANLSHALEQQYKKEQIERRAELETLIKFYRGDFSKKKNPNEYLEAVADDLGVTTEELAEYRLKADKRKRVYPKEITDEMLAEVRELLRYYEE